MPIYEYDCPVCGRFEVIQKFSDDTLKQCPNCAEKGEKQVVTRAVSAAAFHLKGGGWYKTDYASSGSSSSSSSSSSSKSSSSESTTTKTAEASSTTSTPDKPAKKGGGGCGSGCGCH